MRARLALGAVDAALLRRHGPRNAPVAPRQSRRWRIRALFTRLTRLARVVAKFARNTCHTRVQSFLQAHGAGRAWDTCGAVCVRKRAARTRGALTERGVPGGAVPAQHASHRAG